MNKFDLFPFEVILENTVRVYRPLRHGLSIAVPNLLAFCDIFLPLRSLQQNYDCVPSSRLFLSLLFFPVQDLAVDCRDSTPTMVTPQVSKRNKFASPLHVLFGWASSNDRGVTMSKASSRSGVLSPLRHGCDILNIHIKI